MFYFCLKRIYFAFSQGLINENRLGRVLESNQNNINDSDDNSNNNDDDDDDTPRLIAKFGEQDVKFFNFIIIRN